MHGWSHATRDLAKVKAIHHYPLLSSPAVQVIARSVSDSQSWPASKFLARGSMLGRFLYRVEDVINSDLRTMVRCDPDVAFQTLQPAKDR